MARPKGTTKKNRVKQKRGKAQEKKPVEKQVKEVVAEPVEKPEVVEEVVKEEPQVVVGELTQPIIEEPTVEETELIKEETMNEATAEVIEEDIPFEDFNPLNDPVVKREYTKDMIQADMGGDIPNQQGGYEEIIPEPTYDSPLYDEDDISSSSSSNSGSGGGSSYSSSTPAEPQQSINPALDDMPKGEKRKAAKKTADALITTYARVFPYPFKKISDFNMNKMERLDMAGELDLKMVVTEDGQTVRQHMESVNRQVDEVFVVTEEMQEELKEPLVDLLMEQELALTPTQRLMMIVGGQAVQFTTAAIQIALSNRQALNTFKQFHAERGSQRRTPQSQPAPQPQPQPQPQPHAEETAYEAPAIEQEEEDYESPFSMDDYLSGNVEEAEVASVENGGIVVEEEPNE
jgi:hypothetical protein